MDCGSGAAAHPLTHILRPFLPHVRTHLTLLPLDSRNCPTTLSLREHEVPLYLFTACVQTRQIGKHGNGGTGKKSNEKER